ncbi:hypothetical protein [Tenacibaculum piscium]|uniref:hypothetical protein n=1 Tax=Tenacibaculum piscium TaxID=1458515 RepID=UPI00187B4662|nr:hypothetical protein [Tenacibaculum piscium]MBE7691233.1 hypothetical protein [Tenacibaculum piscium]
MNKVTIIGTGQLNGPVVINKELELDDRTAQSLFGAKRHEVITAIVAIHYPGVKINPAQIGVNSEKIKKTKNVKKNTSKKDSNKKKSSTSLIFLPFKVIWKILKWLTKD